MLESRVSTDRIPSRVEPQPNEPVGALSEREAELAEQRRMLADWQLRDEEARSVVQEIDKYSVSPPDEETAVAWAQESWNALVRQYGVEAEARLIDAKKLIARDPRVQALLNATKLGNNVRYVKKAVELARSEKAKGRL